MLKAKKYALNEMQTFQTTLRNQLNLQDSKEACAGQLAHFRKKKASFKLDCNSVKVPVNGSFYQLLVSLWYQLSTSGS